jgi:hemoglobin
MLETHQGMNIDEAEFMAVVDDILEALGKNSIAQREQEEVLFALYSMRREIIAV